jgi:hypothetical protein
MLEVIITYVDRETPPEVLSILTYLRGDNYWQFLTVDGFTINVLDHAVAKVEVHPVQNGDTK